MKKTVKILLVGLILLLVVSTNAYSVENGKMKSNMMFYAGYQGVVSGEDSIHGAVLGLHSKFHIMGLPLFYYVDGNLGYPFVYNEVGEGDRGFLFTASASTGFGWKFMILDNLALDIGAGLELYNLMNITSDLGFLYDCQLVVDILAENLAGLLRHEFMRSPVESVTAHAVFLIVFVRYGVQICIVGH